MYIRGLQERIEEDEKLTKLDPELKKHILRHLDYAHDDAEKGVK